MTPVDRICTLIAGLALALPSSAAAGEPVRFNRDIRPILSDNCFACHGPDSTQRKADLRLDREDGLFAGGKKGPAVVKGKPDESPLLTRILSDDPEEVMPPPASHKTLTAQQKDLIRRWVEQGAPWEAHWSFIAPTRPPPPDVKHPQWARNPIDRFILARLEAEGLSPAPEADRRTLARRLALDLTGLPPEPADVEAFVLDNRPDAYEWLVDKYLASPHFGEHRGRYWLDAARYADTHGIHNDNYREMWPYRDWVIDAFNRNLPFDRFVVEQIAGDLLPGRTLDTQIASGFHRCNITTSEGGSIPEEVAAFYARDRVETTGTVFLGLTAQCASCHDHKFDPVTQKEFYQFAAFFRNTTQQPMDGNVPDTPPVIVVPSDGDRPRWESLSKQADELRSARERRKSEVAARFDGWLADCATGALVDPVDPYGRDLSLPLDEGEGKEVTANQDGRSVTLALPDGLTWGDGRRPGETALRFGLKASAEIPGAGDFEADQAFSVGGWVFVPPDEGSFVTAAKVGPEVKAEGKKPAAPGWTLGVETRVPVFRLQGTEAGDVIEVRGNTSMRPGSGTWAHVLVTYDGGRYERGLTLYLNGQPQYPQRAAGATLKGSIRTDRPLRLGSDGRRDFKGGGLYDFRVYRRQLLAEEVASLAKWRELREALVRADGRGSFTDAERNDLRLLYLSRFDAPFRTSSLELLSVEAGQREIRQRSPVTHVMAEKPEKPVAHILFRGQYDQPREQVTAATPAALHAFKPDWPQNRLGLAWWLIDPSNSLTARVTVNRFWQEVFGQGLVRSAEDFGIQGENPSHPELLDWLAVEFRESGWDVKRFFKLMVTSSAYRQSSAATPQKLAADGANRLLSRGPRFRMDGEGLRDFALASSGLLVPKIGGPSVKPYQPPGVWEAVAMFGSNTRFYKEDTGENLYRRSMYWFWKRSAPPASMEIFNAPSRENCTVRRERTNTPLQALVTMNDPQWVEAARYLAGRAMREAGSDFDARLDFITVRAVSRPFDAREREICRGALDDFLAAYRSNPDAAKKLIETGASEPDAKVPADELAAWTMLASQVMNTDEALNK